MNALIIIVVCIFFIIFTTINDTGILPSDDFKIEGLNEYESALVRKFKSHLEDEKDSDSNIFLRKNDNLICFRMPSEIDSVDLYKVMTYVNTCSEIEYVIDDISIKYNKDLTEVRWYLITYSRKSSI